ncbi:MAG: alpha/beta fold hydrolase [Clostridia bacterium]|nr:alpha/beta fold hydrolase [Clostridia bacterium]
MAGAKKKIIAAVLASLTGFSGLAAASAIVAYDSVFPRVERPDYAVTPGIYCYERIKDELPRKEFFYKSGKYKLKGYYYEAAQAKGLVVVVHGFKSGSDDYLPITQALVEGGYNVFSYDCTGTYDSEGDSNIGMCQSLVDLDRTIAYIQKTEPYASQPLFLLGHSWGGYAASSVLALKSGIRSAALFAPMNNGYTIMVEKGEQYVGKLALTSKPVFSAYQRILFRSYVNYNGVKGINSVDIPVLIAQGIDDKTITYDGQSITAHKDEITNPNVRYYIGKGLQGSHYGIWHSKESMMYQNEIESELKLKQMEKGEKLSHEEKVEYYKTVDHTLYSAVNQDLMKQVIDMFDGTFHE